MRWLNVASLSGQRKRKPPPPAARPVHPQVDGGSVGLRVELLKERRVSGTGSEDEATPLRLGVNPVPEGRRISAGGANPR